MNYCADCELYHPEKACPFHNWKGSHYACENFRPIKLFPLSDEDAFTLGKRLAAKMILRALVDDILEYTKLKTGEFRADRWINRKNEDPCGFDWCCDVLRIEPAYLRRKWEKITGKAKRMDRRQAIIMALRIKEMLNSLAEGLSWGEISNRFGYRMSASNAGAKMEKTMTDEEFLKRLNAVLAKYENPGASNPNRFLRKVS